MPDGSPNAFLFAPAVRENTPIVMALAGASGSGKTFTALELAMGLAGDGKIAVIDTEGRRALHYADLRGPGGLLFRFDHCELRPPFSPERFLAVMKQAEAAGYRVIVVDSFSDEHEGEGGLIDMAAAGRSENTAANWARPKAAHKLVVRWLRQARCHVIFCLRAEERVRFEKVWDEKKQREVTAVVPLGWMPICEKRFMYDMTASFLLSPDQPGIPVPIKLQEQHRRFFPAGAAIGRESGKLLADWAAGGAPAQAYQPGIEERAREAAEGGVDTLNELWKSLGSADRDEIALLIGKGRGAAFVPGELTLRARAVDAAREHPDEIPEQAQAQEAPERSPAGEPAAGPAGGRGDQTVPALTLTTEQADYLSDLRRRETTFDPSLKIGDSNSPARAHDRKEVVSRGPTAPGDTDLLGGQPGGNPFVDLPPSGPGADWPFYGERLLEKIAEQPGSRQWIASVKHTNDNGLRKLKAEAPDSYDKVMRVLAGG